MSRGSSTPACPVYRCQPFCTSAGSLNETHCQALSLKPSAQHAASYNSWCPHVWRPVLAEFSWQSGWALGLRP